MAGRSTALGVVVAAASLALTTLLLYPLSEIAPAVSLGVLYLLAVLLVSTVWGLWLGLATSVAAALAFNFFHIPPTGRFTIADAENWVALAVFLVAAVVASTPVGPGRDARPRGRAAAARGRPRRRAGAAAARQRRSRTRRCRRRPSGSPMRSRSTRRPSCSSRVEGDERQAAVPLGDLGTLLVPGRAGGRRARADRAGARGAAGRRARARGADARGGRDERAAPQRRDQDGRPALGLARPAVAADGDRGGGRGALARRRSSAAERVELADAIAHESRRLVAPGRPADRPLAAAGRAPPSRARTGARWRR